MSQVSTFPSDTRFRVLSHLGTGGMGVVYEALDLERETRVAIKTLRIAGPSQLMRLKREFRALRDIQHPNLVSLGELFEHDGLWFFTMELVQGTSIRQYVQLAPEPKTTTETTPEVGPGAKPDHLCLDCVLPGIGLLGAHTPDERNSADPYDTPACNADATVTGATTAERVASALHAQFGPDEWHFCSSRGSRRAPCFDEQRLRHALKGLGAGLTALHRAGKVHCDIKPSNVMVTREGRVVVLDFSVVTELRTALGPRSSAVMGSPAYMAPEQASGDQVYPATDWYAVGVLLYEAMTGQLPFMGKSSAEIVARKLRGPAPYPGDVVAKVPADLAALCHDLLATRPEDRPDEADILAVLGVAPDHAHGSGSDGPWSISTVPRVLMPEPLFVGREGELARLHAAFEDTRSGRSVSVLIEGESGVGKTATAERFVARLGREVVVLRGQCHEREFVPYNAFDGVVDDMSRYLRASFGSGPLPWQIMGVAPLLSVFPVLRGVPGLVELAAQDAVASLASEKRAQAFAALRTLLTHLAGQTAMVIMIHDLHWADVDSLMLLSELMGACESPPLLFLATARTREDGGSCPAAHGIRGDLRRIELGGLAGDEAEELALRLFEVIGGDVSALIPQVVAETSGHPMLMDALVRHVARGGAHGDTRGDAHVGDARGGEPDAAGMLPRLDDALRARARAQSDDARTLLEIIAVAGAPVEQEILGPASDLPVEALNKELAVLRAANLVRTSGDLRTMVMPYHDRVREVVTGSLTPSRLREIHGRLAHALEAAGAEPVRLAPHYFRAGELAQAAAHAAAAAGSARESLAFDQAVELYRLALRAGGHSPGATRQLIIELGMALQNAGRARDAAMAYGTAAALAGDGDARRDPSDAQTLDLERRAAEQLLMGGYMEDGIEAIRAVLAQESMSFPGTGKRALIGTMWNMLVLRARGLRWRPRAESKLPAEALRAIDTCWSAAAGLSMVDSTLGMFFATRGLRLALRQGEPYRIARAACTAAVVASAIDDTVAAERFIAASARAARQDGGEQARFYVEAARFMQTFFHAQSWRHVVDSGQELENLWHAAGNGRGFESDFVTQFSCFALSFLGDMGELGRRIEALVRDARRVGNRFLEVSLRVYHIMVHLAADDPAGGAADAADAIDSWIPGHDVFQLPHVWALCSRAEAMLYSGEAAERAGELTPGFQRLAWSSLQAVGFIRDISNYAEGRVAVAEALGARSSNPARMQERLRAAARCADALVISPHPVPPLWGTMLRAGIAGVRGEPEHALAHLRHASGDLAATETMLHAAAAIHRMGELLAGDEGAALIAQATAMMRERSVREPQKITATLIPGW